MAIVNVTRPRVAATFKVVLTEQEACALYAVLNGEGYVFSLRQDYPAVYDIIDELASAIGDAAETSAA